MKDENGKTRMAGDAVAELSAKEEGFRNALDRRIGKDEYDRIGAEGHDRPNDRGQYDAAEVIAEFRSRPKGTSVNNGEGSMVEKYQSMVDSGTTFNKRATSYLQKQGVNFDMTGDPITDPEPDPIEEAPEVPSIPAPPPEDDQDPWPFPPGTMPGISGGMSQNVNQDNDIYTSITGDNNVVTNNQDNSISQSSGGSRYLNDWMTKHNFFS